VPDLIALRISYASPRSRPVRWCKSSRWQLGRGSVGFTTPCWRRERQCFVHRVRQRPVAGRLVVDGNFRRRWRIEPSGKQAPHQKAAAMNTIPVTPHADSVPLPISAATAHRRQRAGALLVDIRPQIARHQGSITDALLVDDAAISEKFNPQSSQRIPGVHLDRDIVVCSINTRRALPAATHLMRLGYNHVYFLAGGYTAWQRSNGTSRRQTSWEATDGIHAARSAVRQPCQEDRSAGLGRCPRSAVRGCPAGVARCRCRCPRKIRAFA
jgi:rhodanese-related sulfurtransferase